MLQYPHFDPVAFSLGPLDIHWYGLMYLVGFAAGLGLGVYRARQPDNDWRPEQVSDLLFYCALGVVLGGRLGYVLFYDFAAFTADPTRLIKIWQGGMSFHGGLLGVIAAMWWYAHRHGRSLFQVSDFVAPLTPLGLAAGRVGNFINGELWGKVSDVPWAMQLQPGGPAYHPSQLYEALLEGLALFLLLWVYSRRPRPVMAVSGLFLLGYGVFRFLVEFVRVPDAHLGYLAMDWLTMGQVLSLPMIIGGAGLMWYAYHRNGAPRGAGKVSST